MPDPEIADGWAVLFLPAPSPGQIIRYLERHKSPAGVDAPTTPLLLSDAVGAFEYRALIADTSARPWLEALSLPASADFHFALRLIWHEDSPVSRGGVIAWEDGHEIKRENFAASATEPTGFFARLTNVSPLTGELAWAKKWLLPIDRIPHHARKPLPLVDYETVAKLDQKSLLEEKSPRLYRFTLR